MSITALPSMEFTFTIKLQGSETPRMYEGTFTYRRPNRRLKSEIAKTLARLNGDLKTLDEDTKFLHEIYSTLRHTLTEVPKWWEEADFGFELYDVNVALEVYREVRKFENEWFEKVWGQEKKPENPAK